MNHYAFSLSEEMGDLLAKMDQKRPESLKSYERSLINGLQKS